MFEMLQDDAAAAAPAADASAVTFPDDYPNSVLVEQSRAYAHGL